MCRGTLGEMYLHILQFVHMLVCGACVVVGCRRGRGGVGCMSLWQFVGGI